LPDQDFEAWERALAALELAAKSAPYGVPTNWNPPGGLGALPEDLRERAGRVLEVQERAIRKLGDLQVETAAHLAAIRAVPTLRADASSVYLDVTG
jgi:hypothetical protein